MKGRKFKRQRKARAKPKVYKPTFMDLIATPASIVFSAFMVMLIALLTKVLK